MLPKGAISAVALPNSEERLWLSAPSPPPGWLTAGSAGWAERRHGALQQPPRLLILLQPARLKPQLAHQAPCCRWDEAAIGELHPAEKKSFAAQNELVCGDCKTLRK